MIHHADKYIVGFGEALIDVFPSGEVIGGAPLNLSIRAAELATPLGIKTAMLTRIGDDVRGRQVLERLKNGQVDTASVQVDSKLPTGTVQIQFVRGEPQYSIDRPAAWDSIQYTATSKVLASQTIAICFGTLSQRDETTATTLRMFVEDAVDALKVLDLNLRLPLPSRQTVLWSLEQADVLKCNASELHVLSDWFLGTSNFDEAEIVRLLQQQFPLRSVLWTRGERGCVWQSGNSVVTGEVPIFEPAPNADNVGAGDAACAALVVGLIENWNPERIVEVANLCGASAANQRGATIPMPRELRERIIAHHD